MRTTARIALLTLSLSAPSPAYIRHVPATSTVHVDRKEATAIRESVHRTVSDVIAALRDESLASVAKRRSVFRSLEERIDLDLLAKLTLGKRHWARASTSQRDDFTRVFRETLLFSTYEKIALFADERVEVSKPVRESRPGSAKYRVECKILSKGQSTGITLLLAKRGDAWRAYDVVIEGVSLRKSYASQYADFLAKDSLDDLLVTMRAKVEGMKAQLENAARREARSKNDDRDE